MNNQSTFIYLINQWDGTILFICRVEGHATQDTNECLNLNTYALCGATSESFLASLIIPLLIRTIQRIVVAHRDTTLVQTMLHGEDPNLQNVINQFQQGQQTVRNICTTLQYNLNGALTNMHWTSSSGDPTMIYPFQNQATIDAIQAALGPARLCAGTSQEISFFTIGRTLTTLFQELDTALHLSGHVGHAWASHSIHQFMQATSTQHLFNYLENALEQSQGNFENLVHYLVHTPLGTEASNGFEVLYHLRELAFIHRGASEPPPQNTGVLRLCAECTNQEIQTLDDFLNFNYQDLLANNRSQALALGKALRRHHQAQQKGAVSESRMHHLICDNLATRTQLEHFVLEPSKPIVPYIAVNTLPWHLMTFGAWFAVRTILHQMDIENLPTQQPRPVQPFSPFPAFPNPRIPQMFEDIRSRLHNVPWGVVQRLLGVTFVGGLTITNPMFIPALVRVLPPSQREALIALLKDIIKQLTKKPPHS